MFESFVYNDDYESFEGVTKIWGKDTKTYIQLSAAEKLDDIEAMLKCEPEIIKKLKVLEKSEAKAAKAIMNGLDDVINERDKEKFAGELQIKSASIELSEYGVAIDMLIGTGENSQDGMEFSVYIDEDDSVEYLGLL